MDQETLYRYFKGESIKEDEEKILNWLDESEDNRRNFKNERLIYDISLFSNSKEMDGKRRNIRLVSIIKWTARIAALYLIFIVSVYLYNEYLSGQNVAFQTIQAPVGQRTIITLADGSRVWLNSKSTLTYSANFGKKERNVTLDGEGYFEVAKNTKIPFYVNTQRNLLKVVGTKFNVCAYKGSDEFEVSLIEGIVDVFANDHKNTLYRLTKNEFIHIKGNAYQIGKLKSIDFIRWREGLYCFDDMPFSNMLKKLEFYYDIKIIVANPSVLNYKCTGKFKNRDGIEHILKVIQKDNFFTYAINKEKDTIIIR